MKNEKKIKSLLRGMLKPLSLKVYLIYAVVATLIFTGVSFSRYSAFANASDSAKVAMVVADISGEVLGDGTLDANAQSDAYTYRLSVTNAVDDKVSEVTLKYKIYVKIEGAHPAMTLQISDAKIASSEMTAQEVSSSSQDVTVEFSSNLQFAPGVGDVKEHVLSFTKASTMSDCQPFTFKVWAEVEQVD